MDPRRVEELLDRVRRGDVTVEQAVEALGSLPFRDLGYATVDHHRALRQGVPEVIFGEGKSGEQIAGIAEEMVRAGTNVLVTRIDAHKAAIVGHRVPSFRYAPLARTGSVELAPPPKRPCAPVAVVTAGTSDNEVAEEAAETLSALGLEPLRIYDIGVAGIHRLLHRVEDLRRASAAIVCAGMEGALPSVVGGMVATPVIAVPTAVGYGTALSGFTALFAMLTSCASGVSVVNIGNGFGAAMAVHRMMPKASQAIEPPKTAG
ncbi:MULTISPECIES: nickel pincer cofactor biosynthesis protein LarB [Polyangium]|uniref:Nickel pincer cofactor biosynthesis protein LarB n=2 Tax=Polyangium TaxID=55 RepID=A0A4U1JCP5_9BACT|nr:MULTISPECIES: nickel pincer cofactor biosynthesis protein LarB [Polyangium]MDI1431262.1 nickel pincer cofactor biosynthesis protein LarB [Polyangium sorediatum]TKD08382.1 nickel pincer cofactor biosynthesis protein LarB [Polyangium fumosum]